jgi:enterochelin esterase-like enzyme
MLVHHMRRILLFLFIFLSVIPISSQELKVSAGRLIRIENFPSKYVAARNVDIWLPDNYSLTKKYHALYMHDGQFLYNSNPQDSTSELRVDETLDSLIKRNAISECITIGIWSQASNKLSEYFPQKVLKYLSSKKRKWFIQHILQSNPSADNYLKFIVLELKPYIDKNFPVDNDPQYTHIAGTESAALISLYAMCEYPNVFGSTACIATEWNPSADPRITKSVLKYFQKNLPEFASHRLYFDQATNKSPEQDIEVSKKMNRIFSKKKYAEGYISWNEYDISDSNLQILSKRIGMAFQFILKGE